MKNGNAQAEVLMSGTLRKGAVYDWKDRVSSDPVSMSGMILLKDGWGGG
jgi:hypothetical protein